MGRVYAPLLPSTLEKTYGMIERQERKERDGMIERQERMEREKGDVIALLNCLRWVLRRLSCVELCDVRRHRVSNNTESKQRCGCLDVGEHIRRLAAQSFRPGRVSDWLPRAACGNDILLARAVGWRVSYQGADWSANSHAVLHRQLLYFNLKYFLRLCHNTGGAAARCIGRRTAYNGISHSASRRWVVRPRPAIIAVASYRSPPPPLFIAISLRKSSRIPRRVSLASDAHATARYRVALRFSTDELRLVLMTTETKCPKKGNKAFSSKPTTVLRADLISLSSALKTLTAVIPLTHFPLLSYRCCFTTEDEHLEKGLYAASSDGLGNDRILEVKCNFRARHLSPNQSAEEQEKPPFYCKLNPQVGKSSFWDNRFRNRGAGAGQPPCCDIALPLSMIHMNCTLTFDIDSVFDLDDFVSTRRHQLPGPSMRHTICAAAPCPSVRRPSQVLTCAVMTMRSTVHFKDIRKRRASMLGLHVDNLLFKFTQVARPFFLFKSSHKNRGLRVLHQQVAQYISHLMVWNLAFIPFQSMIGVWRAGEASSSCTIIAVGHCDLLELEAILALETLRITVHVEADDARRRLNIGFPIKISQLTAESQCFVDKFVTRKRENRLYTNGIFLPFDSKHSHYTLENWHSCTKRTSSFNAEYVVYSQEIGDAQAATCVAEVKATPGEGGSQVSPWCTHVLPPAGVDHASVRAPLPYLAPATCLQPPLSRAAGRNLPPQHRGTATSRYRNIEVDVLVFSGVSRLAIAFLCCSILTSLHLHTLNSNQWETTDSHEVSMEQRRNDGAGGTKNPRENQPTSGIVRHDSHLRKSGVNRLGIEPRSPWWEASSLTARGSDLNRRSSVTVRFRAASPSRGAAVAERLACSPPTKANRVQYPAGSPDFRKWESCRMVGEFSRGSPVSPGPFIPAPLHIHSNHPRRLLSTLAVKSRPNVFIHSASWIAPQRQPVSVLPSYSHHIFPTPVTCVFCCGPG
ncbi:hypothetical protein PR048_003548 [Dryococelus australis]|uniref:Uncharacterized protein n=1 Tax=Dryococelus australis TaxID=614101 RepID=A0ABQ9INC1_9NEOP|nr:hypothetical protein PR048_003548 [Dryococelus australis]